MTVPEGLRLSMVSEIVPASEDLVAEIEVWLDAEEAVYKAAEAAWLDAAFDGPEPTRGFHCNWDTIKRNWREGCTPLDVLDKDGVAIGFLSGTNFVEIHPAYRGQGLGVLLSDYMLRRVSERGTAFWKSRSRPVQLNLFGCGRALLFWMTRSIFDLTSMPLRLSRASSPSVPGPEFRRRSCFTTRNRFKTEVSHSTRSTVRESVCLMALSSSRSGCTAIHRSSERKGTSTSASSSTVTRFTRADLGTDSNTEQGLTPPVITT